MVTIKLMGTKYVIINHHDHVNIQKCDIGRYDIIAG